MNLESWFWSWTAPQPWLSSFLLQPLEHTLLENESAQYSPALSKQRATDGSCSVMTRILALPGHYFQNPHPNLWNYLLNDETKSFFLFSISLYFFFSPGCSLYLRPLGGNSGKCWQGEQTRCRWHNPEGFARVSDVRNISLLAEVWFIRLKVSHTDSLSSLSFVLPNRSCACDGFPNWRALLHECQQC